jgi:membrane-bound lytic murein transglycosylase A
MAAAITLLASLAACAPRPSSVPSPPPDFSLVPIQLTSLPGWADDAHGEGLAAFRRSCQQIEAMPGDRPIGPNGLAGRASDWLPVCAAARQSDDRAAKVFFEQRFRVFAVVGTGEKNGLFTGYYEPEVRGALTRSSAFPVPLYRRPPDLVSGEPGLTNEGGGGSRRTGRIVQGRLEPYQDRAAIETGGLAGENLELLWLNDPIEAYFLQVQGSGRIRLDDGRVVRVGYAGDNGLPYVSIGRLLVERGAFTAADLTMETLKTWLRTHPSEAPALMRKNPRYVFFRILTGEGPIGASGVALTPGRSLAIDSTRLPYGAPMWLDTTWPGEPSRVLRRLMVAQDTGGAIKGSVRGDVFWGAGAEAERRAGTMRETGRYYLFLPGTVTPRISPPG